METVLNIIANASSLQTLVLMALGCSGFVWIKSGFDKRMDRMEASFKATIEALTYALDKKGVLASEDKKYVDSRLAM